VYPLLIKKRYNQESGKTTYRMRENISNYIPDKELECRIYKELLYFNNKEQRI
jgi:hypothetical protein